MNIIDTFQLPFVEFGHFIKRKVRLIISPQTTGEDRVAIVHVNLPPGGVSEGHSHEKSDEYIFFDNNGEVVLDGIKMTVKKGSLIYAAKGMSHECINTNKIEDLNLLCVFVPPFKPYGSYPELIRKTNEYLQSQRNSV
jgi:mannose-6-phosphate isomerase-like protein (cupin superfamily)